MVGTNFWGTLLFSRVHYANLYQKQNIKKEKKYTVIKSSSVICMEKTKFSFFFLTTKLNTMDDEETTFPSHSLQNSFISTLDHLPCDIVRSLWLIQSCNIKIDNWKSEINEILLEYSKGNKKSESLVRLYELKKLIRHLTNESIQEAKAMKNQLITHKLNLLQEMEQLNKIDVFKHNNEQIDESQRIELREQLKKHYLENPLALQVEAVEEQKKENESKEEAKDEKPNSEEMIVEIPIQDKVVKPTDRKVVKKIEQKPKKLEIRKEPQKTIIGKPKKPKPLEIISAQENEKEDEDGDVDDEEDNSLYCFCRQKSLGNMISCDNEESCENGEWFHYKCVGLLNRVEALKYTTGKMKWYCSEKCEKMAEAKAHQKQEKKRRKRRRKW